ncbi:MAG TPA: glycosyltransferase, partial [Hanamia sp.]|nr:glycosyltransferase [Hanamia sp.]
MISCIVCSHNDFFFHQLCENIKKTIGVPYEIIKIENLNKSRGICAAYNKGAVQSLYPYLCFVHEDVLFETKNWGKNACSHFENDSSLGLIGIAGCKVKSEIISTWYRSGKYEFILNRYNYRQSTKDDLSKSTLMNLNPLNETISQVVCLDGVFLFTSRKVWQMIKFDESLLNHFHGYDLDFSIAATQKFKVAVVYDILLTHFSEGNLDKIWVQEAFKVHKKWKNYLPISIDKISDLNEQHINNISSFNYFMNLIRKTKG